MDDTLPVSLQFQLRSKLLEKVENKFWLPGAQIPSERELCTEYGVSRITVREVVKELVQEGYLVRKQGKGTFVSLPKFEHEFSSSYSLSQDIEREGLHSDFRLLHIRIMKASPQLQQVFGIADGSEVYEIVRLRLIGDEPFAWERAYTPQQYMNGASEEQLQREGLYMTLFRCSGLMAEEASVEAEAINSPDDIAEQLQLKRKAAVLFLTRLTTAQNRCIEYCESYIRSDRYRFKYKQVLRNKSAPGRIPLRHNGI